MVAFTFSPSPSIAECFDYIVGLLIHRIAEHGQTGVLRAAIATIICTRLRRLADRLDALFARDPITIAPIPADPRPRTPPRTPSQRPKPNPVLTGFDWLNRLLHNVDSDASEFSTTWLKLMINAPEIAARINADPALSRAVRTLCRMLGARVPETLRAPRIAPRLPDQAEPEAPTSPSQALHPTSPAHEPLWAPPIRYPEI